MILMNRAPHLKSSPWQPDWRLVLFHLGTVFIVPRDALVIKLLRSPYANAIVEDVKTDIALKVPGMVAVYTLSLIHI